MHAQAACLPAFKRCMTAEDRAPFIMKSEMIQAIILLLI